ncbi:MULTISPECIES: metallophosphoesterase [Halococcus]|uniref:Metallophosphoesterase n=1 Tax=Halococcus salifodinae DSM 8989 TaxID=1227456 RepID=M0N8E0_9EURY|nr:MULTISPECIES: metallophosphoesterase [Halococcus]EMA53369.1 metallophosphoesterase [Halococcus salifodinae DSM 8989]
MARAESARVEPVPGEPAAVIESEDERALCVADYHAGLEAGLGRQGVELPSQSRERREHLLSLCDETSAERVVFLGDLAHAIGGARGAERDELETLFAALDGRASVTVVKGNHDGAIDSLADEVGIEINVTPTDGTTFGNVGLAHGHTWPSREVLECEVVCVGHEHPTVRLEDDVGGSRAERAWLRGRLAPEPFVDHHGEGLAIDGELVVCPAFNDLSGGTWVNVRGQEFLAPFLPDGLAEGEAYLLDGTRLGNYERV